MKQHWLLLVLHSYDDTSCVVTMGTGKFYSAGLDINEETPLNQKPHQIAQDMHALLARVLTFPLPTIAAISGNILTHSHSLPRMFKTFFTDKTVY